jgi:hypothetical protein
MVAFMAENLVLINPVRIGGPADVARGCCSVRSSMCISTASLAWRRVPKHRDLPLERVAYAAQDRYILNPQVAFSVDEMVRTRA